MSKSKIKKDISATTNELSIIKNNGIFKFRNGDEYNGCFAACRDTLNIAMDGEGVYTTQDEHIYEGSWGNNVLKSIKMIQYPDESIFSGELDNMKVEGAGTYKFKEGVELVGNFANNKLLGKIILNDSNNHVWTGERASNEKSVLLQPINVFWESVLKEDEGECVLGEVEESEMVIYDFLVNDFN